MSENYDIDKHIAEAERLGKDVADAFNNGWLENLKKADAMTAKRFQGRYEAIKYQLEFGIISEEDYYRKLEEIRDEFLTRDMQEWYKYTDEIYDYRTKKIEQATADAEKELRKLYEEISDDVYGAVDDIEAWGKKAFEEIGVKQQNYKEKLSDYAGSSTGFDTRVTWVDNYWPNGDALKMVDYSLADYEKEIEKLKSFNDSVTKLKERAGEIDKDVFSMFFEELRDMSVDDAKILTDLLLKANDEDFARHFELYKEKNDLAENMSMSYYADEYEEVVKVVSEELAKVFEEVPDEFFEYGEKLGEVVFEGMLSRVNEFLKSIVVEVPEIEASQSTTNVQNTEFSPVYYFYGDRSTTSRTRLAAKNDALFSYFRGLY